MYAKDLDCAVCGLSAYCYRAEREQKGKAPGLCRRARTRARGVCGYPALPHPVNPPYPTQLPPSTLPYPTLPYPTQGHQRREAPNQPCDFGMRVSGLLMSGLVGSERHTVTHLDFVDGLESAREVGADERGEHPAVCWLLARDIGPTLGSSEVSVQMKTVQGVKMVLIQPTQPNNNQHPVRLWYVF